MPNSNPRIGDKTLFYPFGYGWCQCGCNKLTQLKITEANPDGIWATYMEGHEPIQEAFYTQNSSAEGVPKELNLKARVNYERWMWSTDQNEPKPTTVGDPVSPAARKRYVATEKGLLDLFCDLVFKHDLLELEVKFVREKIRIAIKLINDFWEDKGGAKQIVIERLKEALTILESRK